MMSDNTDTPRHFVLAVLLRDHGYHRWLRTVVAPTTAVRHDVADSSKMLIPDSATEVMISGQREKAPWKMINMWGYASVFTGDTSDRTRRARQRMAFLVGSQDDSRSEGVTNFTWGTTTERIAWVPVSPEDWDALRAGKKPSYPFISKVFKTWEKELAGKFPSAS